MKKKVLLKNIAKIMGTNFYARIIPSKERREHLKSLIDTNDFTKIKSEVESMYGNLDYDFNYDSYTGGEIHLGKRSAGWKFLWNLNWRIKRNGHMEDGHYIQDPDTLEKVFYDATKESLYKFIMRDDVEVWDEYKGKQDKDEFWNMAINWTTWNGEEAWDSDSYYREHPEERMLIIDNELVKYLVLENYPLSKSRSDFYSDGLRWSTSNKFS